MFRDKKGYINLGVSSDDFIVGRLDKFQQVVKNLKDFKKTDLDEVVKEVTSKKVTVKEVFKYLKIKQSKATDPNALQNIEKELTIIQKENPEVNKKDALFEKLSKILKFY